MKEGIPQPNNEDGAEKLPDTTGSLNRNFAKGAATVAAVAVAGGAIFLNMENSEQNREAHEQYERIQEQLPNQFKVGLESYHSKIQWESGTEVFSVLPSHDETKARAVEIALKNGVSVSNGPVTFKQTKEGVPFDVFIGDRFVPYNPDNYSPAELVSLKAEVEKNR